MKKLLILQVAALRADYYTTLAGLPIQAIKSVFPAVTCTAQATLRTALPPHEHTMIANGFYDRTLRKTWFWEQSSRLVQGSRIWDDFRKAGGRVGLYFFQQSLGESVDEIISPAPIHCHNGKMIMSCYSQPAELADSLGKVKLWQYWGPLASWRGSQSVAKIITKRLQAPNPPELIMAYLPGLDYDTQRFGPTHPKVSRSINAVNQQIDTIATAAQAQGYDLLIVGDYAITEATHTCTPNRALLEAGFFKTRTIKGMLYPDFYQSQAFAVVDHQVALIYLRTPTISEAVTQLLRTLPGIDIVTPGQGGPDLIVTAKPGTWFYWSWWQKESQAPEYTSHVDIHNKPGFDPCELFFGKHPFVVSTNPLRIGGTHGRDDLPIALATTLPIAPATFLEVATLLKRWLACEATHRVNREP